MDDPLSIWGLDAEASSEVTVSPQPTSAPKDVATGVDEPQSLVPPPIPVPTRSDDDEPGWGLPSPPPERSGSLQDQPGPQSSTSLSASSGVMASSSTAAPDFLPAPKSEADSVHAAPAVVETSTAGVAVEAAVPYYEQEQSRSSSASASRRASGHSTPAGFNDKAGLKLSTMTAPPTPDEHLPGHIPNPLGPLAVFSPGLSPTTPGAATRLTGRHGVPASAHPALLHQHLTRLHQEGASPDSKGKAPILGPAPPHSDTNVPDPESVSDQVEVQPQQSIQQEATRPLPEKQPEKSAPADSNGPSNDPPDNDGFDDFGEPGEFTEGDADFGDFEDFGEAKAPQPTVPTAPASIAPQKPSLQVPEYPPNPDGIKVISTLSHANLLPWLFSIPGHNGAESVDRIAALGRDGIRETGGTAQVLGTTGGANLLFERMENLPDLPPVVWDRSRTRAQHRLSLNLPPEGPRPQVSRTLSVQEGDKSLPSRNVSPAPRSNSNAPPAQEQDKEKAKESPNEPPAGSRLDRSAAQSVLKHTPESLQLLPVPALRGLVDSATSLTGAASAELTHWLTVREGLSADAETYNTMIRDLVVGASARLGPGAAPPSSRSGSKKGPTTRFTMAAGIPRPQSPSLSSGSRPGSRSGTPLGSAGRSASGRQTPSEHR